jgi:hypothetical protein
VYDLFAGDSREKVLSILHREPRRVVFVETHLLQAAKYAILFAKNEPANGFDEGKLLPTYMKFVLGIADLSDEKTEDTTEPELQRLQRAALRSIYYFSRPDLLYSLVRNLDLFISIPHKLTEHHQYLDIPALFQEATGLTLETYCFLGLSLTALLTQQKPGSFKDNNWYITPENYFSQTLISDKETELIMKEFTIDTQALKAMHQKRDNFEYNFNGLVQHPLVTFDKQRFFPLPLSLLKDKITVQVYWILFDYIKQKYGDKKRHTYTNFMGACFEEYVYRLLERIYPSSPLFANRLIREVTYVRGKEQVKTADNILVNLSSLILIETKISQLKVYLTGVAGDLEDFREDVRKIIVESFRTIQRTKEDFQKGLLRDKLQVEPTSIKHIYPVVITYGAFVQFPLVWKIVEEEIVNNVPNYDSELLNNLQIVQLDDIETIESFLEESGLSFERLLQLKIADSVYKHLAFHTYLQKEFQRFIPRRSKYLTQKFDQFTEEYSWKMFGVKRNVQNQH